MKRHFRSIGVKESRKLHGEKEAIFEFVDNNYQSFFLHFDNRWQLTYLANQIRELLQKDLELAQSRRDIFK